MMKSRKLKVATILGTGIFVFSVAVLLDNPLAREINMPMRESIHINKDFKLDFYYPDTNTYAISRQDGKFDICYPFKVDDVAFISSRDDSVSYLLKRRN